MIALSITDERMPSTMCVISCALATGFSASATAPTVDAHRPMPSFESPAKASSPAATISTEPTHFAASMSVTCSVAASSTQMAFGYEFVQTAGFPGGHDNGSSQTGFQPASSAQTLSLW